MNRKIFICAPGNITTGGPELLHQLADKLNNEGEHAYICYYPFDKIFQTPKEYEHYNIKKGTPEDKEGNIVIIPEVATILSKSIKRASVAIWWLSVDNYFNYSHKNKIIEKAKHYSSLLRKRKVKISKLTKYIHFHQSEYARIFLEKNGITSHPLTDYLGKKHLTPPQDCTRKNIVLYNPKKGFKITKKIINHNKDIEFKPIINMTHQEVRNSLESAKVYIDFGHHPGKDRFPREAAMAGCCIITGRKGSARNEIDVPIPARFKIDEKEKFFIEKTRKAIIEAMHEYKKTHIEFEEYREKIRTEKNEFDSQVNLFFKNSSGR